MITSEQIIEAIAPAFIKGIIAIIIIATFQIVFLRFLKKLKEKKTINNENAKFKKKNRTT